MALVYHGFANNAEPAGAAAGDLLVVFVYGWRAASGGAAAPSLTDGAWTNVIQSLSAAGAGLNVAIRAQWTVRGGSAPSFALSGGDFTDFGNGYVCHRYSGQHATPIAASGEDNDSVTGSALTLTPSVTVPSGGMAAVVAQDWNGGTPYSTPSGYTAAGDPAAEVRAFVHETSGGTTQTPTLTNGDTSDRGASVIIAIAAAATAPLSVVSTSPADNDTNAQVESLLVVFYDAPISDSTGNYVLKRTSDNATIQTFATGQKNILGNAVFLDATANLATFTEYYVLADASAVKRTSDNSPSIAISSTTEWSFTTGYYGGPDMFEERVRETTTTTGTGNITLAGAVTDFRTFNTAFGLNIPFAYSIVGASEYEMGVGVLTSSTTLQRLQVERSSNANALVSFSAGTKQVFCGISANSGLRWNAAAAQCNAFLR